MRSNTQRENLHDLFLWGVAQLARAPDSGSGGRGFGSRLPCHPDLVGTTPARSCGHASTITTVAGMTAPLLTTPPHPDSWC